MIAQAESLKKDLTDKYVVVKEGVAELRRFVGLTGKVKTVNMNCRALVEFDGPEDISWYDIDPSFLIVVDKPQPKKKAEADKAPEKKAAPAKKASGGKSPLEMAREQGAGGGKSEKKLSPLEMARQQGAAGAAKKEDKPAADKPLSPLEQARQQGAAKADSAAPAQEEVAQEEVAAEPEQTAPVEEAVADPASSGPSSATPGSTDEIIALARQQGAFKG